MMILTTVTYLAVWKKIVILKIIEIKKIYSSLSQPILLSAKDFYITLRFQEVQNAYKNCSFLSIIMQCKVSERVMILKQLLYNKN